MATEYKYIDQMWILGGRDLSDQRKVNEQLQAENKKLWKWFSAAKAGIAVQSALRKSEVKELQETVNQLAAQVQELKMATSRRCKICGADFTPLKAHHEKCKPCTIAKTTVSCKKCKTLFAQKHHSYKYCDACFK